MINKLTLAIKNNESLEALEAIYGYIRPDDFTEYGKFVDLVTQIRSHIAKLV